MNANKLDDAVNYLNYVKMALVENEKIIFQQDTEIETLKEQVATLNFCVEQVQLQQAEIEALKSNYESMAQTNISMGKRLLDIQAENCALADCITKDMK